ncbi:MAG: MBL fold metallo-hydrolase [Solitalea-like symbiont of Acarus siro]
MRVCGFKNEQGNHKIYENIQNNGFSPNDITKVLLTHLHYDHIGGTFSRNSNNKMEANFKNAKYYLQAKELNKMLCSITKQEPNELLIALRDHPRYCIFK